MATSAKKKTNQNTSYTTTSGQKVSIKNGVKTYSGAATPAPKIGSVVNGTKVGYNVGGKSYADSSDAERGNAIDVATIPAKMTPETPANIPTYTIPNFGDITGQNNIGIGAVTSQFGTTYDAKTGQFVTAPTGTGTTDNYKAIFDWAQGEMDTAFEEKGTEESRLKKLEKENQLKQKQQAVNETTGQINAIVAQAQAQQLALEGQGRGQTSSFIGGEQARINREAAIQAIPLQAKLAAEQGALELAQEHIDKMFTVQSQDALAKYQYRSKLIESVYNFATGAEQRRLDAIKQKEDRAYDMQKFNIQYQRDLASQAAEYGLGGVASSILKLNPTSPTFSQDIASLQGKVVKPVSAPSVSWDIKTVNGKEVLFNSKTGEIKPISTPGGLASQQEYDSKKVSIQDDINRASELLSNSLGIKASAGTYQPGFFGSLATGAAGITQADGLIRNLTKYVPVIGNIMSASYADTKKDDFLSGVSYIVNNQTFDKLVQLKEGGATFGALSDSERVAIGRAATDLAASTIVDDSGNITGFRGSETKLAENLTKVLEGYKAAQDQLNIEYGLLPEERDEAVLIWNQ